MGLVVQPTGDALLALLAGPSGEGAAATTEEGGVFAQLMASLVPDGSAEGSEGEFAGEGFGLPFPAAPDQESKTSNESALALLTTAALLQFVPQAKPTDQSAAAANPPAIDAASEQGTTPLRLDVDADPVQTGSAAQEGVASTPPGAEQAAVESNPPPEQAIEVQPSLIEPPPSEAMARTSTIESEPANQPSEATNESGVVRSVGNAETSNRSRGGQDNAEFGERGQSRATGRIENTPRASAPGIENAAAHSPVGELRATSQATPLAEALAQEPPAPVEVPPQVDQVAATIFESVEVGATEALLRLDPAEMGEVLIRIHSDADGLRIDIRAERPEAMQMFRDRTELLSQLLGDRGLNLADVNVGLGRGGNGQAAGDSPSRRNDTPANGEFAGILGLDEPGSAARHNRLRSAYNPDGAHIYRV